MRRNVLRDISNTTLHTDAPVLQQTADKRRGGAHNAGGKRSQRRRSLDEMRAAGTATITAAAAHRKQLADHIAALANPRGRSLTTNELRIIIRIAMWLQLHEHMTEADAIEKASVWAGSSAVTIAAAYKHALHRRRRAVAARHCNSRQWQSTPSTTRQCTVV